MTSTHLLLLGLIAQSIVVRATDDKFYKPSLDFRPNNITGLWYPLYDWVGSYYNSTFEFELTPTAFSSTNSSFCSGLRNQTLSAKRPSNLAITETSIWNKYPQNPVNLFLTVWPTDYDFWAQSLDSDLTQLPDYAILSSNPVYSQVWSVTEDNNFNLDITTVDASTSTYRISANYTYDLLSSVSLNLGSCDLAEYSDTWIVYLLNQNQIVPDWFNWTYPTIDVRFDNSTANLTIEGQFGATAYDTQGNQTSTWMAGSIKMVFRGVVDNARSDVLVQGEDQPTWLRTLGFGNNSLNLDDSSSAGVMTRPWDKPMAVSAVLLSAMFLYV
ncbi:uncharacterized protein BO80DRAFT_466722 [Aspergillus ibericus CBS 121593]|uniref:Concanavalin A-like lectin/glucanase n=1 Tax=Aspergillus ibericus CBS 121593 TaxID=1448316 RepID=A0A395GT48_9EURO|nr:hypothetical protein BO80DRAFT_466722 [Aspergillus ibericus CBS 121593]RAK98761.1 hypothetical protein BO80DRAFT_466722 [Aspergillus ibericus CBS 121593]